MADINNSSDSEAVKLINKNRKSARIKLSVKKRVAFAFVVVLVIAVQAIFLLNVYHAYSSRYRNSALAYGKSMADAIVFTIEKSLNDTQVMKDLYITYGNDFTDRFDAVCEKFVEQNPSVASLYIAPDAVIQYVYPSSMHDATYGFRMLDDPEQGPRSQLAIDTKLPTLAGPHHLVEGGIGYIIRNPIYDGDKFIGFTICIIDWDRFTEEVLERVKDDNSLYEFAVWKENDPSAVVDEYGYIFNSTGKNLSRDLYVEVQVPNDVWYLAIAPVDGWSVADEMNNEAIISTILGLFVIIFSYVILRNSEKNKAISEEMRNAFDELNRYTIESDALISALKAGQWFVDFDNNGNISNCYYTDTINSMLGYSKDNDIISTAEGWKNMCHNDDKLIFWNENKKVMYDPEGNKNLDLRFRLKTSSGNYKWVHSVGRVIQRKDGTPLRYLGILMDEDNDVKAQLAAKERLSIIESMGKVYYASFYIDIVNNKFSELTSKNSIRKTVGISGNATEKFALGIKELVVDSDVPGMEKFVDLTTINERLKDRSFITHTFEGRTVGTSQAYMIAGDRDHTGKFTHVFFAVRIMDEDKNL